MKKGTIRQQCIFINHFSGEELSYTWKEDERDTVTFYTKEHRFYSFPEITKYDDEITIKDGQITKFTIWAEMDERIEKQVEKLYEYLSSAQRTESYEGSGVCGKRDGYEYDYQKYYDDDTKAELARLIIEKDE